VIQYNFTGNYELLERIAQALSKAGLYEKVQSSNFFALLGGASITALPLSVPSSSPNTLAKFGGGGSDLTLTPLW
jgi:hypothetical protein